MLEKTIFKIGLSSDRIAAQTIKVVDFSENVKSADQRQREIMAMLAGVLMICLNAEASSWEAAVGRVWASLACYPCLTNTIT